ncbi:MAG: hypothetical protein ACEQSX_00915 [Baekduiaceae bacterium]
MSVTVYVGGRLLPVEDIEAWERARALRVARTLQRRLRLPKRDIAHDDAGAARDMAAIRAALVDMKLSVEPDVLRRMLRWETTFSGWSTRVINALGLGRRRSSVTEIFVEGCSAEEMRERYYGLMLRNSPRNRQLGLIANPDHYVLEAHGETVQEVIETTGGSPMPSRFFIYYGVEDGLTSRKDPLFPVQLAGVCCLEDGTAIGGIRHQMRDHAGGLHARLEVEFPARLLPWMIRQHQMHLACEFHRWFTDLLDPASGLAEVGA